MSVLLDSVFLTCLRRFSWRAKAPRRDLNRLLPLIPPLPLLVMYRVLPPSPLLLMYRVLPPPPRFPGRVRKRFIAPLLRLAKKEYTQMNNNNTIFFFFWLEGIWHQPQGLNFPFPRATMLAICLDCSTAAFTTPQKVLSIRRLVELMMLDFSDCTRTGISILKSAPDFYFGRLFTH